MKAENYLTIVLAVLVCFGVAARGESTNEKEKGYMGINLDTGSLPDLLAKHLRLEEGQGMRIQNVGVGTPADLAGLERDDIIVSLNGKSVTEGEKFVKSIQGAGPGADISMEIIHLGRRKDIKLKLTSFDLHSSYKAKFPLEPEAVQSWQPGRIFHMQPDARSWIQIDPKIDPEGRVFLDTNIGFGMVGDGTSGSQAHTFFKEIYTFHYSTDGEGYSVTIEGSPNEDDAKVIVKVGDMEHSTTVGKLGELPKKYREPAEEAVKKARRTAEARQYKKGPDPFTLPNVPGWRLLWQFDQRPDGPFRQSNQGPDAMDRSLPPKLEPRGEIFERIDEQIRQMKRRIEELEKGRGKEPEHEEDKGEKEGSYGHEHEADDSHTHE